MTSTNYCNNNSYKKKRERYVCDNEFNDDEFNDKKLKQNIDEHFQDILFRIKKDASIYNCLTLELRENNEAFIIALNSDKKNNNILLYAPDKFKNNFYMAMYIIKSGNVMSYKYFSNEIMNNYEIALLAVEYDGNQLQYMSPEFQDDYDIVSVALNNNLNNITNSPNIIKYASNNLRDNKLLVTKAIRQTKGYAYKYISNRLKNNKNIIMDALKCSLNEQNTILRYVPSKLQNNLEFCLEVIRLNPQEYQYVPNKLKDNYELFFTAVSQDSGTNQYQYGSQRLRNNYDIALYVAKININILEYTSHEIKSKIKEKFVTQMLSSDEE